MSKATCWQMQFIEARGRYRQTGFIDSGGFSHVYQAFDTHTNAIVAIKIPKALTPDSIGRLRQENEMLQKHRDNPYVVNILDSDLACAVPHLVLEYSALGSLQKCIGSRHDWRTVAKWLYQISYGLTIIHEHQEFVRDIKPSNLLRFWDATGEEIIKIADFGLGKRFDTASGTRSPLGTEGYIDPVAQITQNFTPASDIFSLGITAIELLTGSRDLRTAIPGPPEFQSLVKSMTSFNLFMKGFGVNSRPTARQVCERLVSLLEQTEVPVPSESAGTGFWWGLGLCLAGLAVANSNSWDNRSQRYRDSNGRFRSGRFF